jgi:hypothetical protein
MDEGPLQHQIQHRAYEIWLNEGCPAGRDRIHWLRAEAELRESLATHTAACLTGCYEPPSLLSSKQVQDLS